MDNGELLKSIRPHWLHRAVKALAQNAGVQEDFYQQATHFFDALELGVQENSPTHLDLILTEWAQSQTQTDIEGHSGNMAQLINEITLLTYAVCSEHLTPSQLIQLSGHLIQLFNHMFQKVVEMELSAQSAHTAAQIQQLEQTLRRVEKSKSAFISIATHELRTPLTLIEGYATMLNDKIKAGALDTDDLMALSGILKGTSRLRSVISDMADVSMIDNNLLTLNFQPSCLSQIIKALQAEFSKTIEERQQHLYISAIPGSSDIIYFDVERMAQVFRNVMQNAIKFTPNGGNIFIEGRKLPGFIEVNVRDSGIGISPDDQLIIFDKFSQLGSVALHSSSKTGFKGGGPGLGLHIAKGIIEAHGGAIWVESPDFDEQTCPGSTFHILVSTQHAY